MRTISRRHFLKYGAGGLLLVVGGGAAYQALQHDWILEVEHDSHSFLFLTLDDRFVLFSLVPVLLTGKRKDHSGLAPEEINQVLHNMDATIARLPDRTRAELRKLFDLMGGAFGRVCVAGLWTSWSSASAEEIGSVLIRWQSSVLELLNVAYYGLHSLVVTSHYCEADSWTRIGYSGPPHPMRGG
ncbi:MAG: hypothetical protein KDD69_10085 [Bdellovibrionales bacterium]|nr:hypothetical protein [Bdellovibrionales bacterium]